MLDIEVVLVMEDSDSFTAGVALGLSGAVGAFG